MKRARYWLLGLSALALLGAGAGALLPGADVSAAPERVPAAAVGATPKRIVSLNLCVDQILLDLVPRERIAGLSFLASDPSMSRRHREAIGIPPVRGSAEEVLALDPDLVLAGEWTTPATVDLLRRLGRRVEVVPLASSFSGIRDTVSRIADAAGASARGREIVATFDRRLEALRSASGRSERRPTAVAMQVNSIAAGPGSLVDEILRAAGFDNLTARVARSPQGRLPLESLLADPPDLVVLANAESDFRTVLADNLRHPAFLALAKRRPSLHLPMSEWLCGTPSILDSVALLEAQRSGIASLKASPGSLR